MCGSCGCMTEAGGRGSARTIALEVDLLADNNVRAAANRDWFRNHGILALNLLSSPGSGKTTLLTRSLMALQSDYRLAVIEGDQQTDHDAERIRATGVSAIQINTGRGCHLDGVMVSRALDGLRPAGDSILFIENVGNLVCPAMFDLGEAFKIVILSVTEGEDKPLKYPDMFHAADLVLLNKIDLLPHLQFDVDRCREYMLRIKPGIEMIRVSAHDGSGMGDWYRWLAMAYAERRQAS
jgi:hydrogenase nickel incorporation protein HypB